MKKTATLSPCGTYRYRLTRGEGNLMPVVMLNPSTADSDMDDPTIRRLLGFAARGIPLDGISGKMAGPYDGIDVVNLYALRSPNPKALLGVDDPYGPDNARHHAEFARAYGGMIIVAWGANARPAAVARFEQATGPFTEGLILSCFGTTKDGHPKHPLYLPGNSWLCPFFGY